jgi:hypothetical protein
MCKSEHGYFIVVGSVPVGRIGQGVP